MSNEAVGYARFHVEPGSSKGAFLVGVNAPGEVVSIIDPDGQRSFQVPEHDVEELARVLAGPHGSVGYERMEAFLRNLRDRRDHRPIPFVIQRLVELAYEKYIDNPLVMVVVREVRYAQDLALEMREVSTHRDGYMQAAMGMDGYYLPGEQDVGFMLGEAIQRSARLVRLKAQLEILAQMLQALGEKIEY